MHTAMTASEEAAKLASLGQEEELEEGIALQNQSRNWLGEADRRTMSHGVGMATIALACVAAVGTLTTLYGGWSASSRTVVEQPMEWPSIAGMPLVGTLPGLDANGACSVTDRDESDGASAGASQSVGSAQSVRRRADVMREIGGGFSPLPL